MDRIRVCFRAVDEINMFCTREVEEQLYNLVLKVMLNNGIFICTPTASWIGALKAPCFIITK